MNAFPAITDVLDTGELWERLDGDRALLGQLVTVFTRDVASLQLRISGAIETNDAFALAQVLHSMKGALGVFAPRVALETVRGLERVCLAGDLSTAPAVNARLVDEIGQVLDALRRLHETGSE